MYRLQVCRSHNNNNTPREWETVATGPQSEIVEMYFDRTTTFRASGDEYRIVDADGIDQVILSTTTCGPMY